MPNPYLLVFHLNRILKNEIFFDAFNKYLYDGSGKVDYEVGVLF